MGVLAVVVAGHVAGNDHHRDAVEGGVGDSGCGVGHARSKVTEHHRGLAGDPGVAVGGMGGNLLMANIDKADGAFFERRQHRDIGVAAEAEDMFDASFFEVSYQLMGYKILHEILL